MINAIKLINDLRDGYTQGIPANVIHALDLPIDPETGDEIKPTTCFARRKNGRFIINQEIMVDYGSGIKIT